MAHEVRIRRDNPDSYDEGLTDLYDEAAHRLRQGEPSPERIAQLAKKWRQYMPRSEGMDAVEVSLMDARWWLRAIDAVGEPSEPVAWQWRFTQAAFDQLKDKEGETEDFWKNCPKDHAAMMNDYDGTMEVRPLYTHPSGEQMRRALDEFAESPHRFPSTKVQHCAGFIEGIEYSVLAFHAILGTPKGDGE